MGGIDFRLAQNRKRLTFAISQKPDNLFKSLENFNFCKDIIKKRSSDEFENQEDFFDKFLNQNVTQIISFQDKGSTLLFFTVDSKQLT